MIAVLDMGSNSFILLVVSEKGKTVLEEVHEVGIASGNLEKAKEVFKECVEKAEKMGAELHVFGTAFFRKHPDIFQQITGDRGEILPEEKEAYYSYVSVAKDFGKKDILVADLGGGSLELAWKDGYVSLELGTHVLNRTFSLTLPYIEPVDRIVEYVMKQLPEVKKDELFGVGGSFVALAALMKGKWDLEILHGSVLKLEEVERLVDKIKRLSFEDVKNLNVLPVGREKTILAGGIVTVALLRKYSPKMTVSTRGYRYGIVWEILEKRWRARGDSNPQPPDPQSGALSN
ncbi:Ppx/GppA phosphatase [Thermotoga sp. TBGT1765]|nr:Ppx/GppA phosphatase [Thermotoga sp. Cell2]KHC91142.1 Ppx/GppA phosphatase [Thermotoga sp. TBGT1765]KHC92055.1 Ppx/GppA phosphatase [Thermotoga sp. TBGT1766]KHC96650.1 Ppx/GppA phosphatase [Thermotoga sp. Xyl54]